MEAPGSALLDRAERRGMVSFLLRGTSRVRRATMRLSIMLIAIGGASAMHNGLGLTPPMAWRSWNAFHNDISQTIIEAQIDALVARNLHVLLHSYYSSTGNSASGRSVAD